MKRYFIGALALAFLLSGCTVIPASTLPTESSVPAFTQETIIETTPAPAVKQAPMCAANLPIKTEDYAAEDGTVIFTHTYQNISLTLQEPEIAEKVIIDFLNKTDMTSAAEQIKEAALKDYNTSGELVAPYHCSTTYAPLRLDHSILSLLGTSSSFTGGTHPENISKAITYDLLTGNSLQCSAILLETVTSEDLLPLIYTALKAQKSTLYEGYEAMVADKFAHGIDHNSDWYLSTEGLCFFFSPYEIGPFASGTVIAQIPYEQLTNVLRDIYFPAERDTASGTVRVIPFESADLNAYSQFAEVTTATNAHKYLLVTDSSVQDLRISHAQSANAVLGHGAAHTIFAAYGLTPWDAIVLETDSPVQISYRTGNDLVTETIGPEQGPS